MNIHTLQSNRMTYTDKESCRFPRSPSTAGEEQSGEEVEQAQVTIVHDSSIPSSNHDSMPSSNHPYECISQPHDMTYTLKESCRLPRSPRTAGEAKSGEEVRQAQVTIVHDSGISSSNHDSVPSSNHPYLCISQSHDMKYAYKESCRLSCSPRAAGEEHFPEAGEGAPTLALNERSRLSLEKLKKVEMQYHQGKPKEKNEEELKLKEEGEGKKKRARQRKQTSRDKSEEKRNRKTTDERRDQSK